MNSAFPLPPPSSNSQPYQPPQPKPELETIVVQIGDAVLASTDTVTCLAERMDELVVQVQQQGYQIFALSEELQTLTTLHQTTLERLEAITARLENSGLAS